MKSDIISGRRRKLKPSLFILAFNRTIKCKFWILALFTKRQYAALSSGKALLQFCHQPLSSGSERITALVGGIDSKPFFWSRVFKYVQ